MIRLPRLAEWQQFGVRVIRELPGHGQSSTIIGELARQPVVVRLTEARLVNLAKELIRHDMLARLAKTEPMVVSPIRYRGGTIHQLGMWSAVIFPFIYGAAPNLRDRGDVTTMGRALAALHRSMARLPDFSLPSVAAPQAFALAGDDRQLIHGAFSSGSVLLHDGQPRVLGFAGSGYGTVDLEIATTLRLIQSGADPMRHIGEFEHFCSWFLDAYCSASGRSFDRHGLVKHQAGDRTGRSTFAGRRPQESGIDPPT